MSRTKREILIVLAITFGMSGVRSILKLIDTLLQPEALNQQQTTLYSGDGGWLNFGLQVCWVLTLIAWGMLALHLLDIYPAVGRKDVLPGIGLAALIGIPGLVFYLVALHFGLSSEVVPSALQAWWSVPVLIALAFANGFAEESVVVLWFITRLRELGCSAWVAMTAQAVLRGSYHLYQGPSAGLGNLVMGLVFGAYFYKTGRVWPLIIAHTLIDVVAFVGYQTLLL
ncbi:CPBP family intramembrane glutamic endopeptidase [Corynebacterium gerontici]|uniref:CAAX amino terminal protease self-immunity n=1 Tax=Corynebacterium gerontici TaxID=2079234 RepID=A0A3G6IYE8_9CORY|nr:CPBP family intramembrane glutamic endopeptidase [Corynebacterium gerontici]AZA10503.1 CAAX amino terminal protease self- immunity [Corynebacterium gerontici]